MDRTAPTCRLHVIPAAAAPIAAVFRRGPSTRWHIVKWDFDQGAVESGAWLNGSLYPRRSNLSPDGKLLGYFAYMGRPHSPSWPESYLAVSKLPWLTALAAWENSGTWSWGCGFGGDSELQIYGQVLKEKPFHGSWPGKINVTTLHCKNLSWQDRDFRLEEERGWTEGPPGQYLKFVPKRSLKYSHPPRSLSKSNPKLGHRLVLVSQGTDFAEHSVEGVVVDYLLDDQRSPPALIADAAWADWDRAGRLLLATLKGELQVREYDKGAGTWDVTWSQDLNPIKPQNTKAPDWARSW